MLTMCQLLLTQSLLHFQLNSTSEMKPAKGVKIDIHIDSTTINTQNSNASVPKVYRKTYEIIYSIQIIKFEIIFIYLLLHFRAYLCLFLFLSFTTIWLLFACMCCTYCNYSSKSSNLRVCVCL